MNLRTLWHRILVALGLRPAPSARRICARCAKPIKKRGEPWSAAKWDDKQPRHMRCPSLEPPPIISLIGDTPKREFQFDNPVQEPKRYVWDNTKSHAGTEDGDYEPLPHLPERFGL